MENGNTWQRSHLENVKANGHLCFPRNTSLLEARKCTNTLEYFCPPSGYLLAVCCVGGVSLSPEPHFLSASLLADISQLSDLAAS